MSVITLEDRIISYSENMISRCLQKGLSLDEAKDVTQNTLLKIFKADINNSDLKIKFENINHLRNYCLKALNNEIIDSYKKKSKFPLDKFPKTDDELNTLKPIDPAMGIPDKEILQKEKQKRLLNIIEEWEKILKPDEIKFIKEFLKVANEYQKKIIPEVARRLNIPLNKAHDIRRRIQRKILADEAKNHRLKDLTAKQLIFNFENINFIRDIFVSNDKRLNAGREIAHKILNELDPNLITTLDRIFKKKAH